MPAGVVPHFNSAVAQEGGKTSAKPRAHDWRPRVDCHHVIMSRDAHTAQVSKCSREAHFAVVSSPSFFFTMQAQAAKPQEVHKH